MCIEIYFTPAFFLNGLLQIHSLDIRSLLLELKLEEYIMHEFFAVYSGESALPVMSMTESYFL